MPRKKREGIEEEILRFIEEFLKTNGYPPSVREIGKAVGFKSSSTIHGYLEKLREDGKITKADEKTRTINLSKKEEAPPEIDTHINVPVIGMVAAGMPILAEENILDMFPLPSYFSRKGEVFMLKVRGESMVNAGILDGDYVIVSRQNTAREHEMVVAMIDGEATVKRFYREGMGFRLEPENDLMDPIYTDQLEVLGKVIGVIRTSVQ